MFRILSISLLLFWLQSTTAFAQNTDYIDFKTYKPQGTNLTQAYQEVFDKDTDVSTGLKSAKIMLVEGIMANYVNLMGKLIMKKFGTYQYFDDQEAFFKKAGIDFTRVKLETENSSLKNSIVIAKAIAKETKPVVLFTHSKGGVDALMALVNYPDLQQKVAGIVSLQAPFLGTPVADYLDRTQPWKAIAALCLTIMGGSGESLRDLSTKSRVTWYKSNQEAIMKIQNKIPILSFGSHKLPVPGKTDSVFKFSRDTMYNKMGIETDGLVPWKSAILPGSPYVVVEGIDHATSVSHTKYIMLDQFKFTRALLTLFLEVKERLLPAH